MPKDKVSPLANTYGEDLTDQRDVETKVARLTQQVRADQMDMTEWLAERQVWYKRRYSTMDRNVDTPWLGASDIWMPVSDLYLGQYKATMMNLLFGGPRVARMNPTNPMGYESASSADLVMEHLLRGGGVYSMGDFEQQMAMTIDSVGLYGQGVLKSSYSYKTRLSLETLRRDSLPGVFSQLIIIPDPTPEQRENAPVSPLVQALFGVSGVIDRKTFDRIAPALEAEFSRLYELTPSEELDKKILKGVMGWMRSGFKEREYTFTRREVIEHTPRLTNVPIQDFILPAGALADMRRCDRATHIQRFTEIDMQQMAHDEVWDKKAVDLALEGGSSGSAVHQLTGFDEMTFEQSDRMHAMFPGQEEQVYEIWQVYHFEDISGSGPEMVVSTLEPNSGALLKKTSFLPEHGQFPFSVVTFEMNEAQYRASRGIPAVLQDIEGHVTAWYRNLENSMEITTNPSYTYDPDKIQNPNDIEWFPGVGIPAQGGDAFNPIVWPQTDFQMERLTQFYMQWPERLIGGLDQSALTQGPTPERRTATEAGIVDAARQRVVGMRGTIFMSQMKRPLSQVWSLYKQFGPRELFTFVAGEQPTPITQAMTVGQFHVAPYGAVGHLDPQYREQQALARLQMGMQVAPLIGNDVRGRPDIYRLYKDWAHIQDPMAARATMAENSPEEQQQILQQRQAEAARAQELSQAAQAAMANAKLDVNQALALTEEVAKLAGRNKELQAVVQMADQAQAEAEAAQAAIQ